MPSPTFVTSYSSTYDTTVNPKTVSVTTLAGDVLVVVSASENGTDNYNTISGNSISYTQQELFDAGTGDASVTIWTGTDATGGTGWTLSVSRTSSSQRYGITCYVFRNSDGIGSAEVSNSVTAAPSLAISTTQANSAIVVVNGDWDADDGSSRTWRTVNGVAPTAGNNLERLYYRDAGGVAYTAYSAYYDDAGSVGSKTVGLTIPSSQHYAIAAVEVKGSAAAATIPLHWVQGING